MGLQLLFSLVETAALYRVPNKNYSEIPILFVFFSNNHRLRKSLCESIMCVEYVDIVPF